MEQTQYGDFHELTLGVMSGALRGYSCFTSPKCWQI